MKRNKSITKPTGRKPMRIGALLLKEVPYQSEWRIQATWRDPDRKKKWFNNWRAAEEFAAKENKRLDLLKEKGAGRYTFNDAADSYIKEYERRSNAKDNSGCTRDSFAICQGIIENHLRPRFGHMQLTEISSRQIRDWVLEQCESAKTRTVRHRLGELNRALNHAAEREMLPVNPLKVSKVRVPGKIEKRAKIPARSDLEVLRDYINGPRPLKHSRFRWSCVRMVVVLAVSCGLRGSEASALEWDDIDKETGEIDINKARGRLQGLKGPKTEAGYRKIPTTPAVREIINQHAEVYKQFYGKCVGCVLRSRDRGFLTPHMVSRMFTETMQDCRLIDPDTNRTNFTHHAGRHWTASHWLKSTADIHQTTKWMGHKNASMTMDIYGHSLDDPEARAKFERMPDWLVAPIQIESPSAAAESLALPAPEDTFEFAPKAEVNGGSVESVDVPDIAEPWVKPFVSMLAEGTPLGEAYGLVLRQLENRRGHDKTRPITLATAYGRVEEEFIRLKLPSPKKLAARFRAEKILKLHGQKYQALDIAKVIGCHVSRVHQVLRSRHKSNANNPLNRKINLTANFGRKPQPKHKIQLKLL